jgi:release factor glutamine methyltransferase
VSRQPLRLAIMEAERVLADAGVASPRVDAELLAAHVLGVDRGKLMMRPMVEPEALARIGELVERRAAREPLQHLLGATGFGPAVIAVGRGVFTPRPETELLLEWGLAELVGRPNPLVVDLCTGSGALAVGVAVSRPDAVVHAVEADSAALTWARRNIADHVAAGGTPIALHHADVRSPELLLELEARVDLVLCNPPYVPDGVELPPEVGEWDPPGAVFGGPDGLDVIRAVIANSAPLLRYGGALAIEHDDLHGEVVPALLRRRKVLADVEEHHDLAGRPRFATARRRPLHPGS